VGGNRPSTEVHSDANADLVHDADGSLQVLLAVADMLMKVYQPIMASPEIGVRIKRISGRGGLNRKKWR